MTWHVDHTTDGFEPPVHECPVCKGEGWHYMANDGRFADHPIREFPCGYCRGTGVTP
jgi:DnaJ-class molecular chaperone